MNHFLLGFLCFLAGLVSASASIIILSALAMHSGDDDTTNHFTNDPNQN